MSIKEATALLEHPQFGNAEHIEAVRLIERHADCPCGGTGMIVCGLCGGDGCKYCNGTGKVECFLEDRWLRLRKS